MIQSIELLETLFQGGNCIAMVRKEKKCKVILDWKIGSTKVMGLGWVEKYVVPRATAAHEFLHRDVLPSL